MIQVVITDIGRQKLINDRNNGTANTEISKVSFGTGKYVADATATKLKNQIKELTQVTGSKIDSSTISLNIVDSSNDEYLVSEIGFWLSDGTLFAIYADTKDLLSKTELSYLSIELQIKFDTLDTDSITFGDINVTNPPASETIRGIVQFATQAEVVAGNIADKAISPKTLKNVTSSLVTKNELSKEVSNIQAIPVGTVLAFSSNTIPEGFLLCNGASISRVTYANLFNIIGGIHGSGDGSTTFNIPDLRGLFIRGVGGNSAGLGAFQNMGIQSHSHTYYVGGSALNGRVGINERWAVQPGSTMTSASGGIETRPVNMAFNYIIKF
ncbi:tail fiber protein [Francisella philomiragia]|uniref:Phage Tail Collar domain protein n=1 Tax=Francisella philomiragia TaxID=28110 RepID=A0A0B6CXA9_9GAMM|nr:tail fiber protein [Francisella philomiragia]AJI53465.1 phage Tail Collar domain protein [Francisella philomiragia]